MRTIAVLSLVVLLIITVVGIGAGTLEFVEALHLFGPEHVSVFTALIVGAVPFAVGTVALGAIAVAAAVLSTAPDQPSA